jgi:hypothetical protein
MNYPVQVKLGLLVAILFRPSVELGPLDEPFSPDLKSRE